MNINGLDAITDGIKQMRKYHFESERERNNLRKEVEYWKNRFEKQRERNEHIADSNKLVRAKLDYYLKREPKIKEMRKELAYYQNGYKE